MAYAAGKTLDTYTLVDAVHGTAQVAMSANMFGSVLRLWRLLKRGENWILRTLTGTKRHSHLGMRLRLSATSSAHAFR